MQLPEINHPIYKVVFGIVAIASLFNLWLIQSLSQSHCAQVNLALVKLSIGSRCLFSSQLSPRRDP